MAFDGALVYKNAALTGQNLTSGGLMVFDSEVYDTNAWHDAVTNTGRLTIPSGVTKACFLATLELANVTANVSHIVQIFKNGAAITQAARFEDQTNRTTLKVQVFTGPLDVVAGDYFEVHVTVSSGTADIAANSSFAGWKAPAANDAGFSGAVARKAADQSGADYSAGAVVAFDSEEYDVGNWHDTASNNHKVVVPSGVTYVILHAMVAIQAFTAAQWCEAQIRKNGAAMSQPMAVNHSHGTATILRFPLMTPPLPVTPGDDFELFLQTQTDASITVTATRTWLSIRKVA